MLGAGERRGVLLDADDVIPLLGEGEGDGVAACAGEQVDDGVLAGRGVVVGAEVFGNFAWEEVSMRDGREKEKRGGKYVATGSGVTPNQASSVRRMS